MVVPHYSEDFLDCHRHCDKVTATPGRFRHDELDIHTANWRLDAHVDVVQDNHHVLLCNEGFPLNAWSDSVAAGSRPGHLCPLLRHHDAGREDAKLSAWSANPSAIPKV